MILTHEINELFEEMRKDKDGEGGYGGRHHDRDMSDMERDSDEDEDFTGGNTPNKTPDTRDLLRNSHISHRTSS